MPSIPEIATHMTLEVAGALGRALHSIPPDRLHWKPEQTGRSAMEIAIEVGGSNQLIAQVLRERGMPSFESLGGPQEDITTVQQAIVLLRDTTDVLISAFESFPPENLTDTLTLPFGGGTTRTYAEIMLMPYWHMTYHLGQISYIQTLYGDHEMH